MDGRFEIITVHPRIRIPPVDKHVRVRGKSDSRRGITCRMGGEILEG